MSNVNMAPDIGCGHVFILFSDILKLSCDYYVIPGSHQNWEKIWEAAEAIRGAYNSGWLPNSCIKPVSFDQYYTNNPNPSSSSDNSTGESKESNASFTSSKDFLPKNRSHLKTFY